VKRFAALWTSVAVVSVGLLVRADAENRELAPADEPADGEALRRLVEDPSGPREIRLLNRTYRTTLRITRPLVLRGQPGTTILGSNVGTVIDVNADDVTLEHLEVRGSGGRNTTEDAGIKARGHRVTVKHAFVDSNLFGIAFEECKSCLLEDSHVRGIDTDLSLRGDGIKLWESDGSTVRRCHMERSRDMVVWYSRHVLLEDNVVSDSRYGTHLMYAHDSTVRNTRMVGNIVGIFVMYSGRVRVEGTLLAGAHGAAGMGIGFKESDAIRLERNVILSNTAGVYLDRTPRSAAEPVVFERNTLARNDVGIRFHSSGKGIVFSGNAFRDNITLVAVDGGGDALSLDIRGNYWSEYEGYDLDGNGVGDVPFVYSQLSTELTDRHPSLAFFRGTLALGLVDAVARAFPLVGARKLLVDPAPLHKVPEISLQ
jgi:nitrous oxidase accessory protein